MTDQELEALAKQAGFSKVRRVWKSHKIYVDTLQPANYKELKAFYDLAYEQGKLQGRREMELEYIQTSSGR